LVIVLSVWMNLCLINCWQPWNPWHGHAVEDCLDTRNLMGTYSRLRNRYRYRYRQGTTGSWVGEYFLSLMRIGTRHAVSLRTLYTRSTNVQSLDAAWVLACRSSVPLPSYILNPIS
jgi:hypothetical protein